MNKIVLVFFAFTLFLSCQKDSPDPDRFKTGVFEIPEGKGYEKTLIVRQDSIQIETYGNRIDTLTIQWKNSFNYTLKMVHPKTAIDEEPIHVKITSISKNFYEFEAVIGKSNYVQKGKLIKKEDN